MDDFRQEAPVKYQVACQKQVTEQHRHLAATVLQHWQYWAFNIALRVFGRQTKRQTRSIMRFLLSERSPSSSLPKFQSSLQDLLFMEIAFPETRPVPSSYFLFDTIPGEPLSENSLCSASPNTLMDDHLVASFQWTRKLGARVKAQCSHTWLNPVHWLA